MNTKTLYSSLILLSVMLTASAADVGSKLSKSAIKNSPTHAKYAGKDGKKPSSWQEVINQLLFYKKGSAYYEFTNFYEAPFVVDGVIWKTSEHYYQAQKFLDPIFQDQVKSAASARDAFNTAQKHEAHVRPDWHDISLQIMAKAVYEKFSQNKYLADMLVMTGNKVLIEDAKANDSFYGAGGNYKGHNYLGRILMIVRVMLGGKKGE